MTKLNLKSLSLEELQTFIKEEKQPAFRAKQIFEWLHKHQVSSFDDMKNLPQSLKALLSEKARLDGVSLVETLISKQDGTRKYLFALENGAIIESVFMKYAHGNTVCVSSQAGCRMGCSFCASTLDGVDTNLTAGEILSQVYEIQKDTKENISGVVIMGSGEPFDNYENVLQFIRLINHESGQHMGQRHITLSTCGLIDKINQLAKENLQITLAISLHAPTDKIRTSIMPVAKSNPLPQLLESCQAYIQKTNRRITFEYALIDGINDSEACARELALLLKNMLCHVNLIPMNAVKETGYQKSSDQAVRNFCSILQKKGIETTIRRKLGEDINGACGQLRRRYQSNQE